MSQRTKKSWSDARSLQQWGAVILAATTLTSCEELLPSEDRDPEVRAIEVVSGGTMQFVGPQEGPFNPLVSTAVLRNSGGQEVTWMVQSDVDWLEYSPSSGTIEPGEIAAVDVAVAGAAAASLQPGSWQGSLSFVGSSEGAPAVVEVSISISSTADLQVSPLTPFDSIGPEGGPFSPSVRTFQLSNLSAGSIEWGVSTSELWVIPQGMSSGILAPGDDVDVTVSLVDPAVNVLSTGSHAAQIEFLCVTTGVVTQVPVSVTVENEDDLVIVPLEPFAAQGQTGGPYGDSQAYTLRNDGSAPLDWEVIPAAAWLTVAGATSGSLSAGSSVGVTVSVDGAEAVGLSAGQYQGSITFRDVSHSVEHVVQASLLLEQPGVLSVTPVDPFVATGPEGGPFTPETTLYTLRNDGVAPLDWQVGADVTWVVFQGDTSGTLGGGEDVELTLALDPVQAAVLVGGLFSGALTFSDTTNAVQVQRSIELTVEAGAVLVVTPETGVSVTGPVGGPFDPASSDYVLSNAGSVPILWRAETTASWVLPVGAGSGTLAPAEQLTLQVDISAGAALLATGSHSSTLRILEMGTGEVLAEREFELSISPAGGASGWTQFSPSGDTRIIYVSTSEGDDAYDGLTTATPKATIQAGLAGLRNGYPEWLLLTRGDAFDNQSISWNWNLSGRSEAERMVVGAYGDESLPRPLVRTPESQSFIGVAGSEAFSHIAFTSLELTPISRGVDAGQAILWASPGSQNVLFEDLHIHGYRVGVNIRSEGALVQNVTLHRCVIERNYPSLGLLITRADGVTVTENVIDYNGWSIENGVPASGFARNVYIQSDCENVVFSRNHSHRSSSNAAQVRSGGEVCENLCVRNAMGIAFGHRYGGASKPGGASGTLSRNVILNSEDHDGQAGGGGLSIGNINSSGAVVASNVIAHGHSAVIWAGFGIFIEAANNGFSPNTVRNLIIDDNVVHDNDRPFRMSGTVGVDIQATVVRDNDFRSIYTGINGHAFDCASSPTGNTSHVLFEDNQFSTALPAAQWMRYDGGGVHTIGDWEVDWAATGTTSTAPSYTDPNRGVAEYLDSIDGTNGASEEDFYSRLVTQRKGAWDERLETGPVIDFVREGFNLPPLASL
ncbi:MAG: hypothetical protein ACJA2W_000799 [Planctomycetota bacterium]|jgi:hypothetical protein